MSPLLQTNLPLLFHLAAGPVADAAAELDEANPADASGGAQRSGQAIAETTAIWNGFKITWTFKDGEHKGFEMTCYNPDHRHHRGLKCCRSVALSARVSRAEADRRLKWWALQSRASVDRETHMALPRCPADLPSLAALDAIAWEPFEDAAARVAKRRRAS